MPPPPPPPGVAPARPAARTDHTAVLWCASPDEEFMVVFGGAVAGGAANDLWALDCSRGDPASWAWAEWTASTSPPPPPRTSHAAALVNARAGRDARLLVLGGHDARRGAGAAGVLADAWLLGPLGRADARVWARLDVGGEMPLRRCRHAAAAAVGAEDAVLVFGGFDGARVVDRHHSLFCLAGLDGDAAAADPAAAAADDAASREQERWAADVPLTAGDLADAERAAAERSALPLALAKALHRKAVTLGRDTYIDPPTGYSVFTSLYLRRRPCCGNGCRHCPHGHVNVPKRACGAAATAGADW